MSCETLALRRSRCTFFGGGWCPGRFHVEPLDRIGFVAGSRFIKIFGGIGKLRGEFGDEFDANFVAAWTDRRTDRGEQIGGLAAKFLLHAADGFFGNAGKSSAPTRMNCGNGALLGIDEKNGNAIGGLHSEATVGHIRDRCVAMRRFGSGGGKAMDQVGMNLL